MPLGDEEKQLPLLSEAEPMGTTPERDAAKLELLAYLQTGTSDWSYKDGFPYIEERKLRDLALRAGYTEYALGLLGWSSVTDLEKEGPHHKFPQNPEIRIKIRAYGSNNYGLESGVYDGVAATQYIVVNYAPDLQHQEDPLQQQVLVELKKYEDLRKRAHDAPNKIRYGFVLGSWRFHIDGTMDFWLNCHGEPQNASGWYSLDELELWLKDDPSSPVLRVNEEARAQAHREEPRKSYKEIYREAVLAQVEIYKNSKTPEESVFNRRLVKIALMRCVFPEVIQEVQQALALFIEISETE